MSKNCIVSWLVKTKLLSFPGFRLSLLTTPTFKNDATCMKKELKGTYIKAFLLILNAEKGKNKYIKLIELDNRAFMKQ